MSLYSEKAVTLPHNVALNYIETAPNGRPLILLHGGSARWQAFENIIPELAKNHHLFALDLRGHGKSARVSNSYAIADYAQDIAAFIHTKKLESPILFGHSLGGIIALYVAGKLVDDLTAVIIGDSPLTASSWQTVLQNSRDALIAWRDLSARPLTLEQFYEAVKDSPTMDYENGRSAPMRHVFGEEHPVYDFLAPNLYHQDPDVLTILIEEYTRAAAGYEMTELMPNITCPTLLLQADPQSGGLMTNEMVESALKLLPQPHHTKLEGISHVLHNEDRNGVLTAVQPFLSQFK